MATNIVPSGPNPQQPLQISELFVPDQLIAGDLKIVSDSVTVSGASVLMRGTVMGQAKFGTATASTGKAFASGTITVAALPTAGDTLTVNGTAITFNALPTGELLQQLAAAAGVSVEEYSEAPPPGTQWIAATVAAQAAALAEYLNTSTDVNISKMTFSVAGAVVTATSKIIGTGGNAYTLATSDSSAFTVAANLTNGTANTGTSSVGSISLGPTAIGGNYTIVAASTSATSVLNITDPSGNVMPTGIVGTAYKNAELNFTITDATTTAGDTYVITSNPTTTGVWKQCIGTAVDGSEAPAGILADYCDPTGGNVTAGMYLMAEVNGNALIMDPSLTLNGVKASLRPVGIFVKTSVSALDPT